MGEVAFSQGSPKERLQNKIVNTRKCLPEAQGSPQERLQNKIVISRKCLPKALARGLARKGLSTRYNNYY